MSRSSTRSTHVSRALVYLYASRRSPPRVWIESGLPTWRAAVDQYRPFVNQRTPPPRVAHRVSARAAPHKPPRTIAREHEIRLLYTFAVRRVAVVASSRAPARRRRASALGRRSTESVSHARDGRRRRSSTRRRRARWWFERVRARDRARTGVDPARGKEFSLRGGEPASRAETREHERSFFVVVSRRA